MTGPKVTDGAGLLADAGRLLDDMVALRRDLHTHPELGLELPRTQRVVLEALDAMGLVLEEGRATTSVVAVLEGDRPGPTTLLRGDMDALPMPEDTGLPYASATPGVMHACGHDAHTAMLVGAARILHARRGELAGRVVFMFQPGEEGHAGARVMLDEGLLDGHGPVERAFAIHATPLMPSGWIATRAGTLMASADAFRIVVTGRGGHASMPHDAVDPVPVACELVGALSSMVTRRVSAFDPAVVTVSSIRAGTTSNVIPETAVLEGTVRAVSDATRASVLEALARVAEHVAAAHLCSAELTYTQTGYPVTVNNAAASRHVMDVAAELLGSQQAREMPAPVMGAEDWSFVLQKVPGAMAFLGMAPAGVAQPAPNHSNRMVIDEQAMVAGAAMHAAVALSPVSGGA
ncbi:MAG TPA: M20 family metallopeptidase [Acidimicrobiales bacterium]|nr:M20 family metallopeptidase [Acidimicrobiales bacterium]